MAELDGNPVIEAPPAPAPVPAAPAAPAAVDKQTAPAPEPTTDADDVPFVFTRPKSEKKPEATLDPKTIPPELEPYYKSMQADYTRKTQEAARKMEELQARQDEFQRNQLAFFEAIKAQQGRAPAEENAPDVFQTAQALREEGRHQEADRLLYDHAQQVARAEIQPFKEQAQIETMKATFRDVATEAISANPVVAAYKDQVIQIFDQKTPLMQQVRAVALKDEQSIKTFVPMLLHFIATEQHAIKLEKAFNTKVEKEVQSRLDAERKTAGRVPPRLIESGGTSRTSPNGEMSLAESFEFALSKLGKA